MYIDSHTHFDLTIEEKGCTIESLIAGLRGNDIKYVVQVSIDSNGFEWSYDLAKNNNGILFSIGIHPSSRALETDLSSLSDFVSKIKISSDSGLLFAIGETGLDFYRMRQTLDMQIQSFEYQVEEAVKWGLPVIVHSRDAMDDTLRILRDKRPVVGIMHCFSGNRDIAKRVLDLGFYISFAGNLTYKKATDLHEAASFVPSDRLLLETDSPFLTPVPLRGKKNRSEYVIHTYEFIAKLRKEGISKLKDSIYQNFNNLIKGIR